MGRALMEDIFIHGIARIVWKDARREAGHHDGNLHTLSVDGQSSCRFDGVDLVFVRKEQYVLIDGDILREEVCLVSTICKDSSDFSGEMNDSVRSMGTEERLCLLAVAFQRRR